MADTQRQRGCRVWLQNTAQQLLQIRLHIVLATVLIQNDLSSDLRALNCEKFSKGIFSRMPMFIPPILTTSQLLKSVCKLIMSHF